MNSRSIHSRWLVVFATLFLWIGVAHAGKKKIVVLDFDGPKGDKFHDEVVKLVEKKATVIPTEKWNSAAADLDAAKVNTKNIKKVATKLKADGVIWGKVTKKEDVYVLKLKLRSGTTGEILGEPVQTSSEKSSLDSTAQRDIKDELLPRIADLEVNKGGSDEAPTDQGSAVVEDKPKKSGFGKHGDSEEDKPKKTDPEEAAALETKKGDSEDEEKPKKKKKKKVADEGEGEGEGPPAEDASVEGEVDEGPTDTAFNLSPAHRAVDAVVGLSFTARNLKFNYDSDLANAPPGYKQSVPVGGALVDVTVFPMAFGHKKSDITTNFGLNVLYDRVLVINSRKRYLDDQGMSQTANLSTSENRWSLGAVFRYPFGKSATAPVVGASLSYGKQTFTVAQQLPNMTGTDIPSVAYKMITPAVFVHFPVTPKIVLNLDAGFHAISNTGDIQERDQYGAATVSGYTLVLGADYMITKNIFARAAFRYQAIKFTFKGDPMSNTNTRDTDPEQDVSGAKDSYLGGLVTAGYVF